MIEIENFLIEKGWTKVDDKFQKTIFLPSKQVIIVNGKQIQQPPIKVNAEILYYGDGSIESITESGKGTGDELTLHIYSTIINGNEEDTYCFSSFEEFEIYYNNHFENT